MVHQITTGQLREPVQVDNTVWTDNTAVSTYRSVTPNSFWVWNKDIGYSVSSNGIELV